MLILTRRIGKVVRIGLDISVSVVSIKGAQVRLAFSAPLDVEILREELYDPKKPEGTEK
jgi:carbon storage regulator